MESRTLDLHQYLESKQLDLQPETRPSTTFRSTGRDKNAHWSNRFRKDFHDLDYDVKYSLIKGKSDMDQRTSYINNFRESKKSKISEKKRPGSNIQKYQKRVEMIKMNKIKNPMKINLVEKSMYSTIGTKGLCKFQFQKTIEGKLVYKSNGHLDFQNQTHRPVNKNNVYYNPQLQINSNKIFQRNRSNNKSHHFQSYTQRKVFQPYEHLDKFYNTQISIELTSSRSIKSPCKIDGLIARKPLHIPQSSRLSYNEYDAKKKVMEKICAYTIPTTQREFFFTRQIISPERGCYR